jgi:hypothetical protein
MAFEPVTSNEITLCITKYALFPALIDGIYSCLHWPAGLLCPVGTHDITGLQVAEYRFPHEIPSASQRSGSEWRELSHPS